MKIPLLYQRTEYDCGPTALLNALNFLFAREEIPPDILKYIVMYTMDTFNKGGETCKEGTTQFAMMFLANWLNQYAKTGRLPIEAVFLSGADVSLGENSRIISALRQGGCVVHCCMYGCGHYVTLTGIKDDKCLLFDPYYRVRPFRQKGIKMIPDNPCEANRLVDLSVLNKTGKHLYAIKKIEQREAVILFNASTRKTVERTSEHIEYFI
jgi:hypothetical protein